MKKLDVDAIQIDNHFIQEMVDAYHASFKAKSYCHSLGMDDSVAVENIAKVYPMVDDLNYCAKCPGVDKCAKNYPHYISMVTYKNGFVSTSLVPCKKLLNQVKIESQFKVRDFNEDWSNDGVSNINKNRSRQSAVIKYSEFRSGKSDSWIYLTGQGGTGRSYLAAVMCNDLARQEKGPICFLNTPMRVKELQDLSFRKSDQFQSLLDYYCSCPVLVLDDFGNEVKSDFVRDGIIFPILSKRANKHLFTIITSDFDIDDIVNLYSVSKAASIRASQIGKILKASAGKEISLGLLSVY